MPRTTPPPGRITAFETLALSADKLMLRIEFTGGAEFSATNPCSRAYVGWAEQVGDDLQVGVVDVTPHPKPCDAIGFGRSLTIHLEAPFLGFRVVDLAGYIHFVRRPNALAELHGLPPEWPLRAEHDVGSSPTGRWQRTYSPFPNPLEGTSKGRVDFIESFDGPAGVTGGEDIRPVTVRGDPATLYRHAPSRELVLVWTIGRDGVALVANETDFPVDRLIALAESATQR